MILVLNKINNQKGIGLVEVIAALGISVVVLTSLVSLSLFTVRSSLQSKLQLEGTKIANRELELVRAFRDGSTEWENGVNGFLDDIRSCRDVANACNMDFSGVLSVDTSGVATQGVGPEQLTRYFTATRIDGSALQSGDEEIRVTAVAQWMIGADTKYARVYTDLTNWEKK